MPSHRQRVIDVSSIAIIGAGPTGLAAAKYLLAEKAFRKIDIYEQRAVSGGLWDYKSAEKHLDRLPVPQTDHSFDINGDARPDDHLTPLYDQLETNIPRGLMGFSDLDWPKDECLFPPHQTVTQYLDSYAEEVKHLIKFGQRVVDCRPATPNDDSSGYQLRVRDAEHKEDVQYYDAIIAATGHFNVPYVPDLPGLEAWRKAHPGRVSHSMMYTSPERYRDKKTIIIGNGSSGVDIANQVVTTCKLPLLRSVRSESFLLTDSGPSKLELPDIREFDTSDRSVVFVNGHREKDVDAVLFCTGYYYSFPWLHVEPSPITDGARVEHTYQHLFYAPRPTLAFPVLQTRTIVFAMAEVQAAVIARVWSGRLALPSDAEMQDWEDEQIRQKGSGRQFHQLNFPEDADHIRYCHDWAMSAHEPEKGKMPPRWGDETYWLRERFPAIRKAYQDLGEARKKVKTIEELGFDYQQWKMEQE